jgi:hypothetical protein
MMIRKTDVVRKINTKINIILKENIMALRKIDIIKR